MKLTPFNCMISILLEMTGTLILLTPTKAIFKFCERFYFVFLLLQTLSKSCYKNGDYQFSGNYFPICQTELHYNKLDNEKFACPCSLPLSTFTVLYMLFCIFKSRSVFKTHANCNYKDEY